MPNRRSRKPFSLEEAKLHLSDLLWLIAYKMRQGEPELADLVKATHAFAQGAGVLKTLTEAEALQEMQEIREALSEIRENSLRA